MRKHEGMGKIVKRELMRAVLERAQTMNMSEMMKAFGASDPMIYEDVEETLNVAYVNREEAALAMDIFKPREKKDKELPVILILHGGGLYMGDRGLERPYSRLLAHKGYLVFSLEYRLAPKATLAQQLDDVCAGMDHVGSMLVDYDVDFSRIFLIADSAGAYLAAYVSAMHGSEKLQNAIGYKPSRMVYAAVGFICGMFYAKKELQEQIYGDKRHDAHFLKYMNIEHPEIIRNLPPAFFLTSCGDIFNNYSIRFNAALKKYGMKSKLLYLGNEELMHIFPIMNPEHPDSLKATDRMLAWFEEQADIRRESRRKKPETEKARKLVSERIKNGGICDQKVWSCLKERIAFDEKLRKRTAIIDCTREYSYEQMYQEWDRYARAFSALDICAENESRAALCGVIAAEPLFALFGLNMTGAQVSLLSCLEFLPGGMWKTMIEKEKITDLIISDIIVTPRLLEEIEEVRARTGLRHVIYMHSRIGGPAAGPAELTYNELNYHMLKGRPDTFFMNDLLEKYQDTPIKYDESKGERAAFITHTWGRETESRKPLTYTDQEFNQILNRMPAGYHSLLGKADTGKPLRVMISFDFSSVLSLAEHAAASLAAGDTIITTFFGFMHPRFLKAIDYYNVNVLTLTGFMVDQWMKRTDIAKEDFSSLRLLFMSGGCVSAEKKDIYTRFFKDHGFRYEIRTPDPAEGASRDLDTEGMEYRPAYDIFKNFNMNNEEPDDFLTFDPSRLWKNFNPLCPWNMFMQDQEEDKDFKMPEIPENVRKILLKYGNRLAGLANGRRWIDHDFED